MKEVDVYENILNFYENTSTIESEQEIYLFLIHLLDQIDQEFSPPLSKEIIKNALLLILDLFLLEKPKPKPKQEKNFMVDNNEIREFFLPLCH